MTCTSEPEIYLVIDDLDETRGVIDAKLLGRVLAHRGEEARLACLVDKRWDARASDAALLQARAEVGAGGLINVQICPLMCAHTHYKYAAQVQPKAELVSALLRQKSDKLLI